MSGNSIHVFLVRFNNEISFHEIPLLRGAILNALGKEAEVLFHNHVGESSFRYSYPLIQYKRINKKAAIFCIGKGVEAIGQYLSSNKFNLLLGERSIDLEIESVSPRRNLVQTWQALFSYHLRNWIALNSENYLKYKSIDGIVERITFLEKILIANLLSFAKGMNIEIKEQIECKIIKMDEPHMIKVKDIKMMTFDLDFKTNLSLPDYMGIGKHASIGFGTVVRMHNK